MNTLNQLGDLFEAHRSHLRGVAFRMLGTLHEAEDAVQEAWLKLNRSDAGRIENLKAWLTTVVARVCLDMLRSRKAHPEETLEDRVRPLPAPAAGSDPEQGALLADSVGLALLVVLDTLAPAERVAFVLHDVFDVSFNEIAPIVGRSPEATRQLASRARRRLHGAEITPQSEINAQRSVVDAFLRALRAGDFEGLVAVLDPDVIVRAGGISHAQLEFRGAQKWARLALSYSWLTQSVQPALVNGAVGLLLAPSGRLSRAVALTIADGKIVQIDVIGEPVRLRALDIAVLP
jgi:RNA polymerase sigma factor (sigma-70 family)